MELRLLRYFLTVAKEQSFTKAAEQLHITQPTLSRQMAAFEEELGITLFVRNGKKISLTEEGILLKGGHWRSWIWKSEPWRNCRGKRMWWREVSPLAAANLPQWRPWRKYAKYIKKNIPWFRSLFIPPRLTRCMA